MLLVWDKYTCEVDRMTESELSAEQVKDPQRYVIIGEDIEP